MKDLLNLKIKLNNCWCLETCYPKMKLEWNEQNKSLGQCAVTTLIVNDLFGGDIYKISVNGISHYINIIDGKIIDLTKEQFGNIEVEYKNLTLKTRKEVLSSVDTLERYILLKEKVDRGENMNNNVVITNKYGWNKLIKENDKFSTTILPEYGPFLEQNEDTLNLFDNIKDANIIDIGCAGGESLKYLKQKGANDIWGLDISEEQIKKATNLFPEYSQNFIVGSMESDFNVPLNYFDYAISIFSIGYCSDVEKAFENIYKLLKVGGVFIISWTHPIYFCLETHDNNVLFKKSYFDESITTITKGSNEIELMQQNLKISTILNKLVQTGFSIDKVLEPQTNSNEDINGFKSDFWNNNKAKNCPTTIIYKCKKVDRN